MSDRKGFIVSCLVLCVGLFFCWMGNSSSMVQLETLKIPIDAKRSLVGKLYTPISRQKSKYPVVLLCHGVSSTKEMMAPLAIELARHGVAALAYDSGGFGESYARPYSEDKNLDDARAVVAFVRAYKKNLDPQQIGIGGHSMGGATALNLAGVDSRLMTTIVLGMRGDANPIAPPNLLIGGGLYEQFHPPRLMREMLRDATGSAIAEFQTVGDFAKGRARRFAVSPTADHLIEPYDTLLMEEVANWATQAFNLPKQPLPPIAPVCVLGLVTTFLGGLATSAYTIRGLAMGAQSQWKYLVSWSIAAIAGLWLILGITGAIAGIWASNFALFCAALLPIANYALNVPKKLTSALGLVLLYSTLILLAYGLTNILGSVDELVRNPQYLLSIPQFLLQWLVAMLYSRYLELRASLFPVYSLGLQPSFWFALLFLPELIKPSLLLTTVGRSGGWVMSWLRQPLQIRIGNIPRRTVVTIAGLLVVLAIVLFERAQSGILSMATLGSSLGVVGQLALLPAAAIILGIRSPWFQRLERWCLRAEI
ncbi:alpha/beta hydrolase [Tumidithrix helvetica PCC 7403]|uniref:alpha/beta hydrolase n=1 Tax=Tumidithrix helvetica TaxID=3457545 RepID=UPI003C9D1545